MNAHFYPYSFGLRYLYIKSSCTANFPSQLHALPLEDAVPVDAAVEDAVPADAVVEDAVP
jgi:hypothetical protein